MIVYHGSDIVVTNPDIRHSKQRLDFGRGFYATTILEQAERWAKRRASLNGKKTGVVNSYEMADITGYSVKDFGDNLYDWIDFVCSCRDGSNEYEEYDIILGKVANDKVFRVVDMYKRGIWNKEQALKKIHVYKTYDQIAFVSQEAIDGVLKFKDSFEVEL